MVSINSREISDTNLVLTYNTYSYYEAFKEKYYRNSQQFRERIAYWKKFEKYGYVDELEHLHDFGGNTDWLEVISQQKFNHSHNLTLGKRIKNTAFNMMLTYKDFNGILKKNSNRILNGHLVIRQSLFRERLKFNATLISHNNKYSQINYNPVVFVSGYNYSNIISYAELFNPTVVEKDQAGNYPIDTLYKNHILQNPSEILNIATDQRSSNTHFAVVNADFRIFRGLYLNAGFSILRNTKKVDLSGKIQEYVDPVLINSRLKNEEIDYKQKNSIVALKYGHSFKKHNINFFLSNRIFNSDDKFSYYDSTRYSDNPFQKAQGVIYKKFSMNNLHAYITYIYSDIFGLNVGFHSDIIKISDYFKDTLSYQPHIKTSISLKKLFKNVEWLSGLNVVGSYTMKKEPNTLRKIYPEWKDEFARCYDLGIHAFLLQKKISFSMKYYNKMIFNTAYSIPYVYGILDRQFDIENSGLELKIHSNYNINNFSFVQEFCFTHNKSRQFYHGSDLTKYPKDTAVNVGDFEGKYFAGFSDTIDVNIFTPFYFTDDGGTTSNANKAKTGVLGNGIPKYFIGVFNKINYKRFEFSILLKSAFGFEIRNLEYLSDFGTNNVGKNITVTIPSDYIYSLRKDTDYGVLKGGYTKIDYVSLKYTLPYKRLKSSYFEIYFSINNPYIFSHNYGIDPEMLNINVNEPGILYHKNYPETVIYQLGFGVKL